MQNTMKHFQQRLFPLLEGKKIHTLFQLAQECGVSEKDIALAMPAEMCLVVPMAEGSFDSLWHSMCGWECATFIMQHGGSVVEIKGKLPQGKHGGGYFNLDHGQALGGHIRADAVHAVAFLSLPFMGLESHSLQFFDAQGSVLFALYVGREKRQLFPLALQSFMDMRAHFAPSAASMQGGQA